MRVKMEKKTCTNQKLQMYRNGRSRIYKVSPQPDNGAGSAVPGAWLETTVGAAINYRQQQITEADEEKWRHEQAEIAREDRDRKAREAYIAYEEEQKRRGATEQEDWERERGTHTTYFKVFHFLQQGRIL